MLGQSACKSRLLCEVDGGGSLMPKDLLTTLISDEVDPTSNVNCGGNSLTKEEILSHQKATNHKQAHRIAGRISTINLHHSIILQAETLENDIGLCPRMALLNGYPYSRLQTHALDGAHGCR